MLVVHATLIMYEYRTSVDGEASTEGSLNAYRPWDDEEPT